MQLRSNCHNSPQRLSTRNRASLANPYVFAGTGRMQIKNHTTAKAAFVAKLPQMPQWGLHDLTHEQHVP